MADTSSVWIELSSCDDHPEGNCNCDHQHRTWRLKCAGQSTGAAIQQFASGPYYGTWETAGGGRTGAMTSLEDCKRRVLESTGRADA